MRKPLRLLIVIVVMLSFTLALAACEKERVPPAATTPVAGAGGGTSGSSGRTPQPVVTRVVLPNASSQGSESAPSPQAAQPTAAAAEPAPASSTGERIHTVAAGETLARIAARYGVTAESIMQANNITNPDIISIGQKLTIPGTTAGGAATGGTTAGGTATGGAGTGDSSGGTSGSTTTYTVKAGETLYSIAERYGVSLAELQRANNITNPNQIYAGQGLVIPVGGGAEATPAAGAPATGDDEKSYTVQRGDTLAAIARKYGVSVAALQQANNIANPDTIRPGQVLTIP